MKEKAKGCDHSHACCLVSAWLTGWSEILVVRCEKSKPYLEIYLTEDFLFCLLGGQGRRMRHGDSQEYGPFLSSTMQHIPVSSCSFPSHNPSMGFALQHFLDSFSSATHTVPFYEWFIASTSLL